MSMNRFENSVHLEGLLYSHTLEVKESGPQSKNPGTRYITGIVNIATDDECLNIVPVHFTYVTALTAQKKINSAYSVLMNIIDEKICSVMAHGKDKAAKMRIDNSAIALNEFYSDRNGGELVSVKRNEGGFIQTTDTINENPVMRNLFKVDMVITGCTRHEADEDKGIPEKVIVKGAIFNFRKELLPVEFSTTSPGAMNYFEGLGASSSEPVFTKVWGRQISETIVRKVTEESAFGEAFVRETTSTRKDFLITGSAKETYAWDDESTITAADFKKAIQDRELYLAGLKQRNEEYQAQRAAANATSAPKINPGEFNF